MKHAPVLILELVNVSTGWIAIDGLTVRRYYGHGQTAKLANERRDAILRLGRPRP